MSGPDWKRRNKRRAGPAFFRLARTRMLLAKTALIGTSLNAVRHRSLVRSASFLVTRPYAAHRLDYDFIDLFVGNVGSPLVHSFEVLFEAVRRFATRFFRGSFIRPEGHDAHFLVVLESSAKLGFQHFAGMRLQIARLVGQDAVHGSPLLLQQITTRRPLPQGGGYDRGSNDSFCLHRLHHLHQLVLGWEDEARYHNHSRRLGCGRRRLRASPGDTASADGSCSDSPAAVSHGTRLSAIPLAAPH